MQLRLATSLAVLRSSSAAERDLEILALGHQVTVLRRQVRGPDLLPADRLILAALGSKLPPGRVTGRNARRGRSVRHAWFTTDARPLRRESGARPHPGSLPSGSAVGQMSLLQDRQEQPE